MASNQITREILRGERDLGDFLTLSTIGNVSALGENKARRAAKRLDEAPQSIGQGVLVDAVTGEARVSPEFIAQQIAQRENQREIQERRFAQQQALQERRLAEQLAAERRQQAFTREGRQFNRDTTLAAAGMKSMQPNTSQKKELASIDSANRIVNTIGAALSQNPETIERYTDAGINLVGKIPVIGGVMSGVASDLTKTPEEKDTRVLIERLVGEVRHELAGAGLTKDEKELIDRWSPMAEGLSQEDAMGRLKGMQEFLNSKRAGIESQLQPYQAAPEGSSIQTVTPGLSPRGAASEERKTINGQTYVKRNGEWFQE